MVLFNPPVDAEKRSSVRANRERKSQAATSTTKFHDNSFAVKTVR